MGDAREVPWQNNDPEMKKARNDWYLQWEQEQREKLWNGTMWTEEQKADAQRLAERDEMGRILCGLFNSNDPVNPEVWNPLDQRTKDLWSNAAERFAEWLRARYAPTVAPVDLSSLRETGKKSFSEIVEPKFHHRTCAYRQSNGAEKCTC